MRYRALLILVGITGFFRPAAADILTIRQEIVAPDSEQRMEITTFLAETETDRREIVARLRRSLAEDREKNPGLLTGFEEVVDEKGRSPSADEPGVAREVLEKIAGDQSIQRRVIPAAVRKTLQFRYPDAFLKHSRAIFSVSRGLINMGVSTWSLMATQHLPFEIALAAGVLTGAMSGGLQWYNEDIQKFLTTSITEKFAKTKALKEGSKFVESFFRWYMMEVGFVAVVEIALTALGHPPTGALLPVVKHGLVTALAAVGAQGSWDIAVGSVTRRDLKLAKTARALRVIRVRSDFITLGLSALAVTGMVGKLAHLNFGNTVFWGMGISGGAYLVSVVHNQWKCRRLMKKDGTPKPPDALGAPPTDAETARAGPVLPGDAYFAVRARLSES